MNIGRVFRLLTVDDSITDEQFELLPEAVWLNREREARPDTHVLRGKGTWRMRALEVRFGERYVPSAYASDAQIPERTAAENAKRYDLAREDQEQGLAGMSGQAGDAQAGVDYSVDEPEANATEAQGASKTGTKGTVSVYYGRKRVRPYSFAFLRERALATGTPKNKKTWTGALPRLIQPDLASNRLILERLFFLPKNADIVIRDFRVGGKHTVQAIAVFVDGLADKMVINNHILEPLMLLSSLETTLPTTGLVNWIKDALVPGNQVMEYNTWKEATENILAGSTVVFMEGASKVLAVETKGWEHRTVSQATTENVVRGPHDAFTESFRANTGLIRARLRSTRLVTEIMQVGEIASTDVAVMYLDGVANPQLIAEVKRRLKAIKVDYLADSGMLEQFLEDSPRAFLPQFLSTERPDRVAYGINEGQVAIFLGQSPFAILCPVMFWSLLQTSEDAYLRWPYGTFIRSIRFISFLFGLLLPGLYIAVTNFHPEMIPTDLMLAIAASRERVPFPVIVEVLVMEFAIELIREAGIRIPTVIGPTIGIVGALILGQAAVAAGIISPLLIIVVAVTALCSFTMPNYNLSFSIRILRFGFIAAAATFGFYGIILGWMLLMMHMVTLRSFGVPIMSPIAPRRKSAPDSLFRGPVFKMDERPQTYWPLRPRRQQNVTRPWSPTVRDSQEAKRSRNKGAAQT
ncbi:MAG: spore germination protein [Firmicutes bacterium]|nr:spore germination protein [Bacillota bacterium]